MRLAFVTWRCAVPAGPSDGGAASSPTEDSHAQCQSESPQTVAMDTTSFRSWGRAQRAGVARAVIAEGLPVHPIPGPSSLLAALCIAGLPADRVLFAGFLPPKTAGRKSMLEDLKSQRQTLVFFESGPRLRDSLTDMAAVLGPRPAAVARELTKLYEECVRGSLDELAVDPRLDAPKGEIVVVIGPGEAEEATQADADAALTDALTRLSTGEAASEVARALGLNRKTLYRRALELQGK